MVYAVSGCVCVCVSGVMCGDGGDGIISVLGGWGGLGVKHGRKGEKDLWQQGADGVL
jgi:hypothetical protein